MAVGLIHIVRIENTRDNYGLRRIAQTVQLCPEPECCREGLRPTVYCEWRVARPPAIAFVS